jgi:ketosteroid isomerase-like protein
MKIKSQVRAGGLKVNHSQSKLRVRTDIKAGAMTFNHNAAQVRALKINLQVSTGGLSELDQFVPRIISRSNFRHFNINYVAFLALAILCTSSAFASAPQTADPTEASFQPASLLATAADCDDHDDRSNLAIIQSLYNAFANGDTDTILDIIHPDVVWIESEGIPYGGTFIGRDAVFEGVFAKIAAEWDGFTATVDGMFEADGKRVVVLQRDGGTFNATGLSMQAPAISIWSLNDQGQVIQFQQVIDTQEVNSAVFP